MGQSASSSLPTSLPDLALHCLRVAEGSPAAGSIEPFFDYLVGVDADSPSNEESLRGLSPAELGRILEDNEGRRIGLRVYNAKSQRIRGKSHHLDESHAASADGKADVGLVPSRAWSGEMHGDHPNHSVDAGKNQPSLLGLSLRICNPSHALESVYHVLDVLEGSPAEARLPPESVNCDADHIVRWPVCFTSFTQSSAQR